MSRKFRITNLDDPRSHRQVVVSVFSEDGKVQESATVVDPGREVEIAMFRGAVVMVSAEMPKCGLDMMPADGVDREAEPNEAQTKPKAKRGRKARTAE